MGSYAVGVVLAAGLGTRVGADGNKAYLPLAGRSMVAWSLKAVTEVRRSHARYWSIAAANASRAGHRDRRTAALR
jgi:2-C-methyl-D-erythritol 4-phosphate cytidylyltransferase